MKKILFLLLVSLAMSGCGRREEPAPAPPAAETAQAAPETVASTDPVTEPELPENAFVRVRDYIPGILVELPYADSGNFTDQVIYDFQDAWLRWGTVKKLAKVQEKLEEMGLGLKIWDAFRPLDAQRKLWEICPDGNFVSDPSKGTNAHSRGGTVDVTLVDAEGGELEMPTAFDDFTPMADRDYSDCLPPAARNAQLLQELMEEAGFRGYEKEWWHFTDETAYPVDECFDPALVAELYADCQEFISLRPAPDTAAERIAKIPAGETFTRLGTSGDFYLVRYRGMDGYVLASYTAPVPRE